jgi:FkbM family methyltransferase
VASVDQAQEEPETTLPPHVRASTVVGDLLLPANDQVVTSWIHDHGTWELPESAALVALIQPGANVLDIGAHVGYMTLLASARVGASGSVLAVEANRENFELLRANLTNNGAGHARAVHGAAWRQSGETLTMSVSPENSGDHRVFRRAGAERVIDVPAVAIDDLISDDWRVDVVKVDVQGTDHVAIEGMQRTIERHHPTMLVEFWPEGIEEFGDSPAQALALYRQLGYEISMLEQPGIQRTATLENIVDAARSCPGEFCTLLLKPTDVAQSRVGGTVGSLIARGPVPGRHSALGPLGPLARKLALRAMKPYTVHQRAVDAELARDVLDLSRRVDVLERGSRDS